MVSEKMLFYVADRCCVSLLSLCFPSPEGNLTCEAVLEQGAMNLQGDFMLLTGREGFSLSSCDQNTRSRSWPAGTWKLCWRRESGMKRKMTLLKLPGLHLQLNRLSLYSAYCRCYMRCLLVCVSGTEEINWAVQWLLILPVLIACSSRKMYNIAGSFLSFEEKLLKIKMSDMTGKCTT